jgi:hypothetical protein
MQKKMYQQNVLKKNERTTMKMAKPESGSSSVSALPLPLPLQDLKAAVETLVKLSSDNNSELHRLRKADTAANAAAAAAAAAATAAAPRNAANASAPVVVNPDTRSTAAIQTRILRQEEIIQRAATMLSQTKSMASGSYEPNAKRVIEDLQGNLRKLISPTREIVDLSGDDENNNNSQEIASLGVLLNRYIQAPANSQRLLFSFIRQPEVLKVREALDQGKHVVLYGPWGAGKEYFTTTQLAQSYLYDGNYDDNTILSSSYEPLVNKLKAIKNTPHTPSSSGRTIYLPSLDMTRPATVLNELKQHVQAMASVGPINFVILVPNVDRFKTKTDLGYKAIKSSIESITKMAQEQKDRSVTVQWLMTCANVPDAITYPLLSELGDDSKKTSVFFDFMSDGDRAFLQEVVVAGLFYGIKNYNADENDDEDYLPTTFVYPEAKVGLPIDKTSLGIKSDNQSGSDRTTLLVPRLRKDEIEENKFKTFLQTIKQQVIELSGPTNRLRCQLMAMGWEDGDIKQAISEIMDAKHENDGVRVTNGTYGMVGMKMATYMQFVEDVWTKVIVKMKCFLLRNCDWDKDADDMKRTVELIAQQHYENDAYSQIDSPLFTTYTKMLWMDKRRGINYPTPSNTSVACSMLSSDGEAQPVYVLYSTTATPIPARDSSKPADAAPTWSPAPTASGMPIAVTAVKPEPAANPANDADANQKLEAATAKLTELLGEDDDEDDDEDGDKNDD